MRNFSDKKIYKTYFVFKNIFSEICAVYVLMWENIVAPKRPRTTI
jgi:hypothetical protein